MPVPNHWRTLAIACLLALAAGAAHGRDVGFGFLLFDDPQHVSENPSINQGLTWNGWVDAWTDLGTLDSNWVPLTRLSHMLDFNLFGADPWGHHLVNVLLHCANAALIFLALRALTGAVWRSAGIGLLLAVHPVHVESVAWVAERRDVLSLFFGCLALWAYAGYARRPGLWRYALVWLATSAAMLAKPTMVTLPLVMALLDAWPLGRWRQARSLPAGGRGRAVATIVLEKLPLLAVAALSSTLTVWSQHEAISSLDAVPMELRLVNAVRSYGAYLDMLVRPIHLHGLYTGWYRWSNWRVAVAGGILLLITYAAVRWRRGRPYLLVGWLWFLGAMVPMIGLVQVGAQIYACRYAYFPFLGLYLSIVWSAAELLERTHDLESRRWLAGGLAALVAVAGIVGSRQQSLLWSSDMRLFSDALASGSDSYLAYHNMGAVLDRGPQKELARVYMLRTLTINSHLPGTIAWLGQYALIQNHFEEARGLAELSKRMGEPTVLTWDVMARASLALGQTRAAAEAFQKALDLGSKQISDWYFLGQTLETLGQFDDAVAIDRQLVKLRPDDAASWDALGGALLKLNKNAEAEADFENALRIDPNDQNAAEHLAKLRAAPAPGTAPGTGTAPGG